MADDIILTSGKRRTSIARARLMKVDKKNAVVRVNGVPIEKVMPEFARIRMREPFILAEEYINLDEINMKIDVQGGGVVSQAEAVRIAIARAIDKYLNLNKVRDIFEDYDRTMIAGDVRLKEPKKAGGPGARRRYQKSYR